ncbi:hypothetical protein TNCV_912631 [Trichonephila clavipes]|nr:hypothetical protein TNCV_912631 [Trichonephila clavipes]
MAVVHCTESEAEIRVEVDNELLKTVTSRTVLTQTPCCMHSADSKPLSYVNGVKQELTKKHGSESCLSLSKALKLKLIRHDAFTIYSFGRSKALEKNYPVVEFEVTKKLLLLKEKKYIDNPTPLKGRRRKYRGTCIKLTPADRTHGRGSLVVKVSDWWQVYQEFEPGTVEDPPLQRRVMHTKNVEAQTFSRWCGVEVERGASSIVT